MILDFGILVIFPRNFLRNNYEQKRLLGFAKEFKSHERRIIDKYKVIAEAKKNYKKKRAVASGNNTKKMWNIITKKVNPQLKREQF